MATRHRELQRVERLLDSVEPDHDDPITDTFPTPSDPPPVEASPAPDIYPFCPNPIC
jgi:hypothetical protein